MLALFPPQSEQILQFPVEEEVKAPAQGISEQIWP